VEVYREGVLLMGLQIKPKSYLSKAPYIIKATNANIKKNKKYYYTFGVKVINVISTTQGEILNFDDIKREL
jgi:hypothetical protein